MLSLETVVLRLLNFLDIYWLLKSYSLAVEGLGTPRVGFLKVCFVRPQNLWIYKKLFFVFSALQRSTVVCQFESNVSCARKHATE